MQYRYGHVCLVVALLQGCSYWKMHPSRVSSPGECSDGYAVPVLDVGLSAVFSGLAFTALSWPVTDGCDHRGCYNSKTEKVAEITVLGVLAFVGAASSLYGHSKVSQCREQKRLRKAQSETPSALPSTPSEPSPDPPPSGSQHEPQLAGTGTCFAVSKDGQLVTNAHVVDGARKLWVFFGDEPAKVARVLRKDADKDIALLKVNRTTDKHLGLRSSSGVDLGDSVFTVGYPEIGILGVDPKYTDGTISSKRTNVPWEMQISVPLQPGNSGGPLVDEEGFVVGITTGRFRNLENASIAIKSDYAIPLLDSVPSVRPSASRKEAVSLAVASVCLVVVYK